MRRWDPAEPPARPLPLRLVIRDVETLGVVQLYSCLDNIASCECYMSR